MKIQLTFHGDRLVVGGRANNHDDDSRRGVAQLTTVKNDLLLYVRDWLCHKTLNKIMRDRNSENHFIGLPRFF